MGQSNLSVALHNRPFQMEGARFAMRHKNVLIADEPGLGKTIQSIAAVVGNKVTGSVLIVAPKTAAYVTWPVELERWLSEVSPHDTIRIIGGNVNKPKRLQLLSEILQWEVHHDCSLQQRQWVIVSPNYLRFKYQLDDQFRFVYDGAGNKVIVPVREALKELLVIQWGAVIVDEAHETLAGATGNVKKGSAQSRGLRMLQIKDGGMRIALSGTPFRGKHENLWGIANWLKPEEYNALRGENSYWKWVNRHFSVYHDPVFKQDIIGNLRSESALAKEASSFMIRRTKKKVLPELPDKFYGGTPLYPNKKPPESEWADLPEKVRNTKRSAWFDRNNPIAVWLTMDGKQRSAYEQMKKEAMADFENGTLLANSVLAEMTRLKQFANSYGKLDDLGNYHPQLPSNKFEWLLQFLKERGIDGPEPSGSRVVVASQFTKHIKLFAQELRDTYKIPSYVLTGETTSEERVRFQNEFQSGTLPAGGSSPEVFLLNTKAGGVSITLDAADDLVLIDSTHNPDDQVQVEDRIHRISRVHNVSIWNVVTRKTIDEQILKATRKTGRSLKRILDTPQAAISFLES